MNKSIYPALSKQYVDLHGNQLNILVTDDGDIFVPLSQIKKTGFHIFKKDDFNKKPTKDLVAKEFKLHMLGAARDFLLQNYIHSVNQDDILETINMCYQQLNKTCIEEEKEKEIKSPGNLLTNPMKIQRDLRSSLGSSLQTYSSLEGNRSNGNENLRMPHTVNNVKPSYSNTNLDTNKMSKFNHARNRLMNRSENRPNNNSRDDSRRSNGSRNPSDAEDVEFRNSEKKYDIIKLSKSFQKVKIVYVEIYNEKRKYWVQLCDNESIVEDIVLKCMNDANVSKKGIPKMGHVYMAMSNEDDLWYRVVVVKTVPFIKVRFIDFGNEAVISEVRELPEELKSIPAQAARMTISNDCLNYDKIFKEEEVISVRNVKEFTDGTIVVIVDSEVPNETKMEPIFLENIKYTNVLPNKEIVKIIAYSDGRFYLRNREYHTKLVDILNLIKDTPKVKLEDVKVGQAVLCKKDDEDQLCRAIVSNIENGLVTVKYIDFFTTDTFSIKCLFNITSSIANLPPSLIESPVIKGYTPEKLNDSLKQYLDEKISNKIKFNIVNDPEFDLILTTGESLSEKLFPKPKVSPKVEKKIPVCPPPVKRLLIDDMKSIEIPLGVGDYMITYFANSKDFTITSGDTKNMNLLTKCSNVENVDDEIYEPIPGEIILGYFEDGYYRGAVVEEVEGDTDMYQVLFIDYGNTVNVKKDKIRKLSKDLMNIPMLGIMCFMNGSYTVEVEKRLTELLPVNSILNFNIISYVKDELIYEVDLPQVTEVLKKEKLL